jgi:hypothetical protein
MAHITPDDGCNHDFAVRYRAILERYQHIIRLNILGHTHLDFFKVVSSYMRPYNQVGVLGICGSVTSWTGNPSFCVYEVDQVTLLPLKRTTYAFDLERANKEGAITWVTYTDYLNDYALEDLSPGNFEKLAEEIRESPNIASNYATRMRRLFSHGESCESDECRRERYCDSTQMDPIEHSQCANQPHYDFKNNFFGSLFEVLQGPWVEIVKEENPLEIS